jgi:hypothetical protein
LKVNPMTKPATTLQDVLALFEQTNAMLKENAAAQAQTERKLNKLAELYSGVSENQGAMAEEFFFNSLNANPVIGGVQYDRITPHLIVGAKGKQTEFDLVLVNGNSVALIEVKSRARLTALDQLEKQLTRYRAAFPEHASYKLYGGIAGLSVPEATIEEAHKRGMFVLKQKGDVFAVDAEAMWVRSRKMRKTIPTLMKANP